MTHKAKTLAERLAVLSDDDLLRLATKNPQLFDCQIEDWMAADFAAIWSGMQLIELHDNWGEVFVPT